MFSIGGLAKRSGVKVPTIRYYESVDLLSDVARSPGGQRRYAQEDLERLILIRSARTLGFGVPEIKRLLALDDGKLEPSVSRKERAGFSRLIQDRINILRALQQELQSAQESREHATPGTLRRLLVDSAPAPGWIDDEP